MLAYLIKSGVCLTVFYLFYKLLLEKESFHIFKRVYLLGGLVLAFAIPLITFTTMVEIEPIEFVPFSISEIPFEEQTVQEAPSINYWPIILWTVYAFGIVVFGVKFLFNLYQIGSKIRKNTKQKVNRFTHVLLQNLTTPHTFFNYIFLNKQKYFEHQIPQEVFWHEESHAKQKHSFDVILIELLQVIFWFNPLLYFLKKDIKLNHEFLADRAVLNKGVQLTAYQEILLAFSVNPMQPQLANAFNYSSIKKRFTIMKTQTSKKAIWTKSLILLPLVAVLVYGFSEQKIVEIEKIAEPLSALEKQNISKEEIKIFINKDKEVSINNTPIAFNAISTELMKISKEKSITKPKLYIEIEGHITTKFLDELEKEISKTNLSIYEVKATSLTLHEHDKKDFYKGTMFTADSIVYNLKNGEKIVGISKPRKENQDKATPKELEEYNKLAKHYNSMSKNNMVVKKADVERLEFIYNKMTLKQKNKAEPFPNFPPPPPPVKFGEKVIEGKLIPPPPPIPADATPEQKEKYNQAIENYNRQIDKTNKTENGKYVKVVEGRPISPTKTQVVEGKLIPPPPPPVPDQKKIEKGSKKLQKVFKEFSEEAKSYGKAVRKYRTDKKGLSDIEDQYKKVMELHQKYVKLSKKEGITPPPPPPLIPPNPTIKMIEMAKIGALFYYEDKKITSDQAIEITKEKKYLHIEVLSIGSSKPIVKLSKKPITVE